MKILTEPINTITFEDVVSFCDEGHIESIQLDYKKQLSNTGLAKHFAAFSNTRGGVIIIGVDEDKKNGKPKDYDGVQDDGKLVDRIHQYASKVTPRPHYEVSRTNEVNGKIFVIVKIHEGDFTPYYVQNDPHIYIRTGNISDLIDQAKPEILELLFYKRERATAARSNWLKRSEDAYQAAILWSERQRKQKHVAEERRVLPAIAKDQPMLKIAIQPFYPNDPFCNPEQIKERVPEYRFQNRYFGDFPSNDLNPFPDGVLHTEWDDEGHLECQQLYSYGLVRRDMSLKDGDNKEIYLSHLIVYIYSTLDSARNFYKLFGYQGVIVGDITVFGVRGLVFEKIMPTGWHGFNGRNPEGILNVYSWDIDTDTVSLTDDKLFHRFFLSLIKEIYWSLGLEAPNEELLKKFYEDVSIPWII